MVLQRTLGQGMLRGVCVLAMLATAGLWGLPATAQDEGEEENGEGLNYLDYPYHKIIPNTQEECAVCHVKATAAWVESTHKKTYDELHTRDRALEIVEKMGGRSIRRSKICTQCHYTMHARSADARRARAVMGVSCQRCHGPAADWFELHANTEEYPDRLERLAKCEELGMRPTYKLYELAVSCYQCHTVPIEDLVNTGGHKAGSDFELVAWSQGEVRHNFLPLPDEPENKERSPEYLRKLYVMGKLLDFEWAMRGLAKAEGDGEYKTAMVERLNGAVEDLKAIGSGGLSDVIALAPGDPASTDAAALISAADEVRDKAKALSDSDFQGFDFGKAQDMLPSKDDYMGEPYEG